MTASLSSIRIDVAIICPTFHFSDMFIVIGVLGRWPVSRFVVLVHVETWVKGLLSQPATGLASNPSGL